MPPSVRGARWVRSYLLGHSLALLASHRWRQDRCCRIVRRRICLFVSFKVICPPRQGLPNKVFHSNRLRLHWILLSKRWPLVGAAASRKAFKKADGMQLQLLSTSRRKWSFVLLWLHKRIYDKRVASLCDSNIWIWIIQTRLWECSIVVSYTQKAASVRMLCRPVPFIP